MTDSEQQRLLDAFAHDVDPAMFERWIAEWGDNVERRTFHSNIVDVTIDFRNDSVEVADVLAVDVTVQVSSIAEARALLTERVVHLKRPTGQSSDRAAASPPPSTNISVPTT